MSRLKNVLAVLWRAGDRLHLIITGGAYLLGLLVLVLVMLITGADTYITVGSYFALIANGLLALLGTGGVYTQEYKELIRCGTSRRTALLGCTISTLGVPLFVTAAVLPLSLLERLLCEQLLSASEELALTGGGLLAAAVVMLLLWMMGMLGAVCINKFGTNGLVAIYLVYMVLMMLGTRVHSAIVDGTGVIGAAAAAILANPLLSVVAAAALAAAAIAILLKLLHRTAI